jgi:hypothetical protein
MSAGHPQEAAPARLGAAPWLPSPATSFQAPLRSPRQPARKQTVPHRVPHNPWPSTVPRLPKTRLDGLRPIRRLEGQLALFDAEAIGRAEATESR